MREIMRGRILPSEIELSDVELTARVGRPVTSRDADIAGALSELYKCSNIRFVATRVKILGIDGDLVRLDGFSVTSGALKRYFESCKETYLFLVTLGSEADRLIMKKRALSLSDGFIFDAVASAVIEAACDAAEKKIHPTEKTKNRFSPGYADCPLSVQREVLRILCADKYIGVKLLDSLLMTPMKSVSAFAALI